MPISSRLVAADSIWNSDASPAFFTKSFITNSAMGLASQFHIESAATSREEIGNPVYPPARRKLAEHGISCDGRAARQLTNADYENYDLLIGMDSANLRNMHCICGGDFAGKLRLLMDYTDHPRDVADPWYTGDFEATWRDVLEGCQGLLDSIIRKEE